MVSEEKRPLILPKPNPLPKIYLPIYNKETFLKRSIGSLQKQTLKEIEIIGVNDYSTDNSYNILKSLSLSDKKILVLDLDETFVHVDFDEEFANKENIKY